MSEEEYTMDDLKADIEYLTKMKLIDAVGITEDGEWLYSLTPEAMAKVKDAEDTDIWCVLDQLVRDTENNQQEEE